MAQQLLPRATTHQPNCSWWWETGQVQLEKGRFYFFFTFPVMFADLPSHPRCNDGFAAPSPQDHIIPRIRISSSSTREGSMQHTLSLFFFLFFLFLFLPSRNKSSVRISSRQCLTHSPMETTILFLSDNVFFALQRCWSSLYKLSNSY